MRAGQIGQWLPTLLFTAGYACVLLWFYGVDVYHKHFSETGPLVLAYNVFRVVFIFYLFWMVHAAGAFLLQLVAKNSSGDGPLDRLALGFFAGTGVWHLGLLALGYCNLYTRTVAVAITLPVVALSFRNIRTAIDAARVEWRDKFGCAPGQTGQQTKIGRRAIAIAGTLYCVVLLIKGLYPGGGTDYFTHYFYYYQTVVDRGGLWPNDVWYHYYYSKGAGLYFLAMLLTDPLAPQLVTFCFYTAQLLVLFLLLRRIAAGTFWPWAGIILFIGLYIYTPSYGVNYANGGWGDFEKLHELNAALILGIIWMSAGALERTGRTSLVWAVASISAIIAAVIINTTVAVYLGAIFGLLMVWYFVRGNRMRALACFTFAAVAGATVSAIAALNYITTGLLSDQGIVLFWPFADPERLNRWGALPLAIMLYWGTLGMAAESMMGFDIIKLLWKVLRLDMLGPLVGIGLALATTALWRRRWSLPAPGPVLILAVAVSVAIGLVLSVGRAQAISFYRYTSFMVALMLLAGVWLCRMPDRDTGAWFSRWAGHRRMPAMVVVACFISAFYSYHPRRAPADAVIDATRFAVGWYSIDKAYTTQDGAPARRPWGGIYPGARGAYAVVGPHRRIWFMQPYSFCMLPDCRVETNFNFIMTPDWDRLMFGAPEEGRQALQTSRINYFLFSTELPLYDPLPLSPLFAPNNIGRYLGVRWTDGTTTLLTWLGPDTIPLDAAWLANYRHTVESSPSVQSFPYADMQAIFARLRATPHPWQSFPLPWGAPPAQP